MPAWTKSTLANGAELIVSEKHDLPLISFSITFLGGADQFEPAGKQAVASLTAAMLSEGTKTRDGEALSNALQLLGTTVNASVGGESGSISFRSTTAKFPATLDILADMLVNPTFPADGPRAAARAAARAADAGARAARRDRQPRLPAHRLRRRASVRPRGHRGIAQGDHARRRRRVSQGVLPAGPRADHRRRRHDRGIGRSPSIEKALAALDQGRREAGVHVPAGRRAARPRRSSWSTSRARRSRRSRSAGPGRRATRPTTTRCR